MEIRPRPKSTLIPPLFFHSNQLFSLLFFYLLKHMQYILLKFTAINTIFPLMDSRIRLLQNPGESLVVSLLEWTQWNS